MILSKSSNLSWYNAMTLPERIESLCGKEGCEMSSQFDYQLAELRMAQWRSRSPFDSASGFAQRLDQDGINEDTFFTLLGEPTEAIRARFTPSPEWLLMLEQTLGQNSASITIPEPERLRNPEMAKFLNLIAPLLQEGRNRVYKVAQELHIQYPNVPFDPETVVDKLFMHIVGQLLTALGRTLVLEMHVARYSGVLDGQTDQERFQCFMKRLQQSEVALSILEEYPVLARHILNRVTLWTDSSIEFIQHLSRDWAYIQDIFVLDENLGMLVEVVGDLSDSHRGGRSVLIARFASGFQLVYKPKSMAVDVHFQELLAWLNERGIQPALRTLKVLNRGHYGWAEFVEPHSCTSSEEVWRFYMRQGGFLALLYVLEATDFHYENLIAAGEHPVLIDLESLFHPRVDATGPQQSTLLASITMAHSVLRVGLLPQSFANPEAAGNEVDISGLGMTPGKDTVRSVPRWENVGSDAMHLVQRHVDMDIGDNRPQLHGEDVQILEYSEAIVDGFTRMYETILHNRDALLSDDGPLARFAQDEVRVIFRPTRVYSRLLYEATHPDALRNALDRDRLFDRLWYGIENYPHLAQIIPFEQEDLRRGDIPMFTTVPGSRHVWSSRGERITNFSGESGLALVQNRLRRLSEADFQRQTWFIRASLSTLETTIERIQHQKPNLKTDNASADREHILAAAQAIGDRLDVMALRGETDATWIGLSPTENLTWSLSPLGTDLYSGLSGVILFLAYLGEITQEERYINLARSAFATLRQHLDEPDARMLPSIGGYSGWGGIIYLLTHLSVLWKQPALLNEAEVLVERMMERIDEDAHLDVTGGAAGCIGALACLYQLAPSEQTRTAAIRCGDRLIAQARPMQNGIGWITTVAKRVPLTGFSHGAAGFAWALFELAALSSEERFHQAALDALAYERSLFSTTVGNWPDLRPTADQQDGKSENQQEQYMIAWCHGASGIGLSRLRLLRLWQDSDIYSEIDAALTMTIEQGFGHNHSLCHGDLGNLDFLLQASHLLPDAQLNAHIDRVAVSVLQTIDAYGGITGVPLGVETPGLMTGLAGIGYGLLRLADPQSVPSVLILEPPHLLTNLRD